MFCLIHCPFLDTVRHGTLKFVYAKYVRHRREAYILILGENLYYRQKGKNQVLKKKKNCLTTQGLAVR